MGYNIYYNHVALINHEFNHDFLATPRSFVAPTALTVFTGSQEAPTPLCSINLEAEKGAAGGGAGGKPSRIFISKQWCGYGSIAMKIAFLGGWTSTNPSYFDVYPLVMTNIAIENGHL